MILLPIAIASTLRIPPPPLAERPFEIPKATGSSLSNGIPVQVVEDHERPFVWVRLAFRAGGFADPEGKEGLAAMAMDLLNDAAGPYDGVTLPRALKKLGGELTSGAGEDGAHISIRALSWNLDATLAVMAEVLKNPHFTEADWSVLQTQSIAERVKQDLDGPSIADRVLDRLLYGPSGIHASVDSLKSITTADIKAWYSEHLGPEQAMLLVGGDISRATVTPMLNQYFGSWNPKVVPLKLPEAPQLPEKTALYFAELAGTQSVIAVARPAGKPVDPGYFELMVANGIFGGIFSSRLNLNLREAHGYTYGARSTLGFNLSGASWSASASVSQAVTVDALKELLYELGRMQSEPITEKEMVFARDYYLGSIPLKYENPDYLLTQIQSIWRYQLPSTWSTDLITGLKAATLEGIQQQWSAKIGNQPCYMVVVGEWAKVGAGIQELAIKEGLEVIQVKKDGTRSSDGN